MSQRQEFMINPLARVPITLNQQGTFEKRDEVLSNVGAQDMDTSRYQLSDLDDLDFYWEDDELDVDAVIRPRLDTSFSPSSFDDLEIGC